MPSPPPQRPWTISAWSAAIALCAALASACSGAEAVKPDGPPGAAEWKQVARRIADQQLEAASTLLDDLVERARAAGADADWARALVRRAQVRIALGGYETAVEQLAAAPWPTAPRADAAVRLYLARALAEYQRAYAWEIGRRERVASDERLDLKLWTAEQIAAESRRQLARVFAAREELGRGAVADFEYLTANSYPSGIRPTLRDAVSYLFAQELADSSRWSPAEGESWRLDRDALLAGSGEASESSLGDPALHPLLRAAAVLGDLERWHRERDERGAELEAKLERLRLVGGALGGDEDRAAVRAELERTLPAFRKDPWWAVGQAELAELVRGGEAPDALIEARRLARAGEEAYPRSYGGRSCRRIREQIEAPSFDLETMAVDGRERRSLLVTHSNLERLHLRAYRIDVERQLARAEFRGLFPAGDKEIDAYLRGGAPAASWSVQLPATPDYRRHRTYAVPPLEAKGAYLLVASARADFARGDNRLQAVAFVLSDLVLTSEPGQETWFRAVDGATGAPLAGVELVAYRHDWRSAPRERTRVATGADGLAQLAADSQRAGQEFVLARRGDDLALTDLPGWWRAPGGALDTARSLVFTDRSLYRPGQTVHFKVLTFAGRADQGRLALTPRAAVTVALVDPNGERVAEASGAANAFGSFSGAFAVPAGRLLGNWTLVVTPAGSASIGVEEYKRPTFEVTLERPAEEPRLNRETRLTGEARYYFGLPVTSGRVAWRVERMVQRPWWRLWGWGHLLDERSRLIASGTTSLDAAGRFEIPFTPEADERDQASGATYLYRTTAEVTDDGGETRGGTRALRLGWVGVETKVVGAADFQLAARPVELALERTDLDGGARAGEGSWRLLEIAQPAAAPLPAELPEREDRTPAVERYQTPGDRLRPRWGAAPALGELLASFADGREVARGVARHGADGRATLALGRLAPGAYRIRYETKDRFGERFEMATDFVVAGATTPLAVPLALRFESDRVLPGGTARLWVHSGRPGQTLYVERMRGEVLQSRWTLTAGHDGAWIEIPVTSEDRGGFAVRASLVADHQLISDTAQLAVPWDDKGLEVTFSTFRDKLRPGSRERFTVTVEDHRGRPLGAGAAELVASMYDRSLDALRPFGVPLASSLYPSFGLGRALQSTLGVGRNVWRHEEDWRSFTAVEAPSPDAFVEINPYGIGGPGMRFRRGAMLADGAVAMAGAPPPAPQASPVAKSSSDEAREQGVSAKEPDLITVTGEAGPAPVELRSSFAETAFFEPHLLTGADGSVAIEFQVPDSVTSWKVWAAAATRDLAMGYGERLAESVKELMVRPYLPRFLREGDAAEVKVLVQNAGERQLAGEARLGLYDPESQEDLTAAFGLAAADLVRTFAVEPGQGADLAFRLVTPRRLGPVAVRVEARAGGFTDGELRPLPILPARVRLAQSRFVTLQGEDRRELDFADLRREDPTRENEQMVVTVDGQLFYGMLDALPYLVDYPYECTEQTLNRFLSTGILGSLYERFPAVGEMAAQLATRDTQFERFDGADPNRRLALEETPWLVASRGGELGMAELLRVLDPRVVAAQRQTALAKLQEAQLPSGAFPWFPGGPPSPWITLYLLYGFGKAGEFDVEVPEAMVRRGWEFLAREAREKWIRDAMKNDCCWESLTFLNYVAASYPDADWLSAFFPAAERKKALDFSFEHWRQHSPMLKLMLAMTLERAGRGADARRVLASVMDSAKTSRDEGTFWAPEDRGWLWYNDTIETHAWAIRALQEIEPEDPRLPGLVQWIFLNKKLNHWKSTRATAEVLYSLAKYLKATGQLAVREAVTVAAAHQTTTFVFAPERFTGKKNQLVIPGAKLDAASSTVVASKSTPGLAFVSATWHFSTEQLPDEARGDLFRVERRYFRRERVGDETVLVPLAAGATIAVGDELEVQLSITARAAAEYIHLRDPRPAGFEPAETASGWRYQTGLAAYQEIRDSGTNFFFEWLPQGEYTLKHRLRAATAGTFRAAPAELQSMYAPEFTGYSGGERVEIAARR